MRHLSYGRIILSPEVPAVEFDAGGEEVGLIGLAGEVDVIVAGQTYSAGPPRRDLHPADEHVTVRTARRPTSPSAARPWSTGTRCKHVKYADVLANPGLHFSTGGPSTTRTLNILLGKNIEAGRLVAGVTRSEPGHWTSWPPHEHAALLEELYVYYDMPPEAFGVQFVYTNPGIPSASRSCETVMPY